MATPQRNSRSVLRALGVRFGILALVIIGAALVWAAFGEIMAAPPVRPAVCTSLADTAQALDGLALQMRELNLDRAAYANPTWRGRTSGLLAAINEQGDALRQATAGTVGRDDLVPTVAGIGGDLAYIHTEIVAGLDRREVTRLENAGIRHRQVRFDIDRVGRALVCHY